MIGPLNDGGGDESVGSVNFQRVSAQSGSGDVMLYVPGIDFAGVFVAGQFRGLARQGHELWRCFVPADDRTPFALMVRHIEEWVRDRLASGRRVVLLGESFGGLLCLQLALRLGEAQLKGLVLVNPATSFARTPWGLLGRALAGLPAAAEPLPAPTASSDAELLGEMNGRFAQTPYAYLGSMALAGAVADGAQLGRVASRVVTTMLGEDGSPAGGVNPLLEGFLTYPEQIAELLPRETVRFRLRAWLRDGCEAVDSELRLQARAGDLPPTLLIASGGDRLLGSGAEQKRLRPLLSPRCGRKNFEVVDLGDDLGHAPLDARTDLARLIGESPIYKRPAKPPDYVRSWEPPGLETLEEGVKSIEPIAELTSPVFCSTSPTTGLRSFGLGNVPDPAVEGRPVVFVGNHQLLALDLGPLVREFLVEKGFAPRGLAHPINFPEAMADMIADSMPAPEPEAPGPLEALGLPFELRAAARASLAAAQSFLEGEPEPRGKGKGKGKGARGSGESKDKGSGKGGGTAGESFGIGGGFVKWGAVPVTPRNFVDLLARGEALLLFPGGAREACHGRYEKYQLFWPEKTDFVRAAAKYDAIVVPFGSVGAADNVTILPEDWGMLEPLKGLLPRMDPAAGNPGGGAPRNLLQVKSGGLMPVSEALQTAPKFPGVLPRLPTAGQATPGLGDRFYFSFGQPVDLREVSHKDKKACEEAYAQLRGQVESEITFLLEARTQDPYRDFLKRRAFEQVANLDRHPRTVGAGPLQGKEVKGFGRRAPTFPL